MLAQMDYFLRQEDAMERTWRYSCYIGFIYLPSITTILSLQDHIVVAVVLCVICSPLSSLNGDQLEEGLGEQELWLRSSLTSSSKDVSVFSNENHYVSFLTRLKIRKPNLSQCSVGVIFYI